MYLQTALAQPAQVSQRQVVRDVWLGAASEVVDRAGEGAPKLPEVYTGAHTESLIKNLQF